LKETLPETARAFDFWEATSAMQKAIRRGDARLGGYWALELFESGYHEYVWRGLLTISAEDCWGILTQEIGALHRAFREVNARRSKDGKPQGCIFVAKAMILLATAKKSRDADHLINLVYEAGGVNAETLARDLEAARFSGESVDIPEYALDCHTAAGRRAGKTRRDFFLNEHDALKPRQSGLFDGDLERVRAAREEGRLGASDAAKRARGKAPSGTAALAGEVGREQRDVRQLLRPGGAGRTKRTHGRIRYIDPTVEMFSEPGWEMCGMSSSGKQIWVQRDGAGRETRESN
jgi:hypothetical protein